MESIECPVCRESFNRTTRMPLVLLCGHSICKKCTSEVLELKKSIVCPLDRKPDPRPLTQISFSYTILELIDQVSTMTSKLKYLSLTPDQRLNLFRIESGSMIQKIDETTDKVSEIINEIEGMQSSLTSEIESAFSKLLTALKERENSLKSELNGFTKGSLNKYNEILGGLKELKQGIQQKLEDVSESSQNMMYEFSINALPEIPEQNLKLKFTEDCEKLMAQIKHYGRIRNILTSVPYNCDHFTNITYWMVPPCCFQFYCCNKCHDKKETHSWTYANRMVCMYCEREQDYRKLPNLCEFCSAKHTGVVSKSNY